ncbi:hypothetical protein [Olivibacter sitiensis]|uniref:hypothetical protein n=1 Tax=Olivibacter sitiensis TaxID=376470 RepID=UPI0004141F01|nr:hypothetical protein [Olivibacter sitiensis]
MGASDGLPSDKRPLRKRHSKNKSLLEEQQTEHPGPKGHLNMGLKIETTIDQKGIMQ